MKQQDYVEFYAHNEMKELKKLIKPLIDRMGLSQMEYDDLYSIAQEVLWSSAMSYREDKNTKFSSYLYNNVSLRFKTYLRDTNREKDIKRSNLVSLDEETDEGLNLEEKVASKFDIYRELGLENTSDKAALYISKLSKTQQKILSLLMEGYKREDIIDLLHITAKVFADNISEIRSDRKIKYLY